MEKPTKKKSTTLSIIVGLLLGGFLCLLLLSFCSDDPTVHNEQSTAKSQSVQEMVDNIKFMDMPDDKKTVSKKAVASLLRACPRITQYATHGEVPSVAFYPEGWEGTPAHIEVDVELTRESQSPFPPGMKDPQWSGHVGLGISGDSRPGVYMHSPLEMWMCGAHLSHGLLQGYVREWPDHVRFLPIKDIPQNSF